MKYSNFLLAFLTGILLWLGWPTYGVPLLLFVAFVPLLFVEKKLRNSIIKYKGWRVLGLAYLSFMIWNITTTWWLYNSTAFGMFFAILVNSLLMALVFLCYHKCQPGHNFNVTALPLEPELLLKSCCHVATLVLPGPDLCYYCTVNYSGDAG